MGTDVKSQQFLNPRLLPSEYTGHCCGRTSLCGKGIMNNELILILGNMSYKSVTSKIEIQQY